jgi:hypothetical protein
VRQTAPETNLLTIPVVSRFRKTHLVGSFNEPFAPLSRAHLHFPKQRIAHSAFFPLVGRSVSTIIRLGMGNSCQLDLNPLPSVGAKGAESGGKRCQIRRLFHPDRQKLRTPDVVRSTCCSPGRRLRRGTEYWRPSQPSQFSVQITAIHSKQPSAHSACIGWTYPPHHTM